MIDAIDLTVQHVVAAKAGRRRWLRAAGRSLAVTAGIALSALLPASRLAAQPVCAAEPDFTNVGQIEAHGGTLQAVIKVLNANRKTPGFTKDPMLRYFYGYNPEHPSQKWPVNPAVVSPGPTLRAGIGDIVNITLLNQVNVADFGGTLDSGEEGRGNGCNQVTNGTDKNFYPAHDKYPNCFHASSSANIHFHGTHVTPSTTGDNILITVRPNQKVTEQDVKKSFDKIFQHCALGQQPKKWEDLPERWRLFQERLLKEYDQTAPYQGGHGLPEDLQLWPQDEEAIAHGIWPQFYSGSYPYCFQIPKYEEKDHVSNVRMGQAPGTHWYHSHKHGSTSINLYNGLSGAFIITDDSPTGYDGKLQAFYQGKLEEKVLVLQQIAGVVNLMSTGQNPASPPVLVNGKLTPTITMRPGQVQLWRLINATVSSNVNATFSPAGINFRQTAQDGVQFAWANYSNPKNGTETITLAPANRVDLLVQAPITKGCFQLGKLLNINVTGDQVDPAMGFPTKEDEYPVLPSFLDDIKEETVRVRRQIAYGSKQLTDPPKVNTSRQFTIDGKQFEDQVIDQVMLLGATEEWSVSNTDTGGPNHPFHIHVNPFQVVEVMDPKKNGGQPVKMSPPYIWRDTFAIPAGGYFKMRTRFVDFTGQYVQHCHILAHEDRGMMQLIEVVPNTTVMKHH